MVARTELGLSDQEFLALSPSLLIRLLERTRELRDRERKEADFRAAIIASTVANTARDRKKKPVPFKPEDFMPRYGPATQETLMAKVRALQQRFGGEITVGEESDGSE